MKMWTCTPPPAVPPPLSGLSAAPSVKAKLKRAAGKEKDALALLERGEETIVDKVAYLTFKGEVQVALGMNAAAEETYWKLLERLPDSYDYHEALRVVKGLPEKVHDGAKEISDDDIAKLKSLYEEIGSKLQYCAAAKRLPGRSYCVLPRFEC